MEKSTLYCTIMAGGQGTRLWPLSRQAAPKQFLDLMGVGRTMLQMTYDRFRSICDPEHFVVVTNDMYRDLVHQQLPEVPQDNIITEPFRRNTAPCIAFATGFVKQKCPDATIIVTPSDHLIVTPSQFIEDVKTGVAFAKYNDALVTVGVRAKCAETAFGYIQVGAPVKGNYKMLNEVRTFTEKPNAEMAQVFYETGEFCWNTGVFIWTVESITNAMTKFLPNVQSQFDILDSVPLSHWNADTVRKAYDECENISIDYGVMEKARNVYVQQTESLWADLGSWGAVYEQAILDDIHNAILSGNAILKNTEGCMVHIPEGKTCIIDGLRDYLVVERDGIILICPREGAKDTLKYKAEMKAKMNNE